MELQSELKKIDTTIEDISVTTTVVNLRLAKRIIRQAGLCKYYFFGYDPILLTYVMVFMLDIKRGLYEQAESMLEKEYNKSEGKPIKIRD